MVQYVYNVDQSTKESTFVALNPIFDTVCTIWEASDTVIYWLYLLLTPFNLILDKNQKTSTIRPGSSITLINHKIIKLKLTFYTISIQR